MRRFTSYGYLVLLAACASGGSGPSDQGPDQTGSLCGNGVVDSSETCDTAITSGAGACPTECVDNDGQPCSIAIMIGTACTAACDIALAGCAHGDGCCLGGCDGTNDDDCSGVCGNGTREGSELCDGDCPTSCDDQDACTTDTLAGMASTCNVTCTRQPVTSCAAGDGCCAPGCTPANDADCTMGCGNGVVEPPEVCDGNCPPTCDDNDACTTDGQTGSAGACNLACSHSAISACADGDGCCPSGCNGTNDDDCGGGGTCTLEYGLTPRIRIFGIGRPDIETNLSGGRLVLRVTADVSNDPIAGPAEMLSIWLDAEYEQTGCALVLVFCVDFDIPSDINIFSATCNATRFPSSSSPPDPCNYVDSTTTGAVGTFNGSNALTWGSCSRHSDYPGLNYGPLDTAVSVGAGCAKNFRTVGNTQCPSSDSACDDYGYNDGNNIEDLLYNQPLEPIAFTNGVQNVSMDWINLPNARPGMVSVRFTGVRTGGTCAP